MGKHEFNDFLKTRGEAALRRGPITTLQVNVGKLCNQACHHCHVEAGPKRTEIMEQRTAERIIELLEQNPTIECIDLTGGAPELNPHFRDLVCRARALGKTVLDRCNLTVLFEAGQENTAEFLAAQQVVIVASLPCYTAENVDRQRGKGVFGKSIEGLRWLNRLGYSQPGSSLQLHLVYNPLGPQLPPPQAELEDRYHEELQGLFDIQFDHLLTITNMPIKRFALELARSGQAENYLSLLVNHFNPSTLAGLMCRSMLSVGHDGRLYDCDFNQMLEIPLGAIPHGLGVNPRNIWEFNTLDELHGTEIATDSHCFGCTAGGGSSCSGALV